MCEDLVLIVHSDGCVTAASLSLCLGAGRKVLFHLRGLEGTSFLVTMLSQVLVDLWGFAIIFTVLFGVLAVIFSVLKGYESFGESAEFTCASSIGRSKSSSCVRSRVAVARRRLRARKCGVPAFDRRERHLRSNERTSRVLSPARTPAVRGASVRMMVGDFEGLDLEADFSGDRAANNSTDGGDGDDDDETHIGFKNSEYEVMLYTYFVIIVVLSQIILLNLM